MTCEKHAMVFLPPETKICGRLLGKIIMLPRFVDHMIVRRFIHPIANDAMSAKVGGLIVQCYTLRNRIDYMKASLTNIEQIVGFCSFQGGPTNF